MPKQRRIDIDWSKIQLELESGLFKGKEVANNHNITYGMIKWAKLNSILDNSKWNLRKHKPTNEEKNKISNGIKKAHAEGRHPGWSFINKDLSRRSYPEKVIFDFITKNNLQDTYQIIEKLPIGKYFLDFAFIDLKLDLEVDGQTHYRTDKAIEHDKKRNEWLISQGWKIYRINWIEFNKNKIKEFEKFLSFLIDIHNRTSEFYKLESVKIKKVIKNQSKYFQDKKIAFETKIKPKINELLNSEIDFSKFGWVKQAAIFLDIKQQKVNHYMKRFAPDFYKQKCFKRNG